MCDKKVVINDFHGGFGLSDNAIRHYARLKKIKLYKTHYEVVGNKYVIRSKKYFEDKSETFPQHCFLTKKLPPGFELSNEELDTLYFSYYNIPRDEPELVQTVEDLGQKKVSTRTSNLTIVKIPEDIEFQIEEYDGKEWVAEKHRTWP